MGEYLVLQSEHTQNVCQDKMWDCGMRQLDLKKEKKQTAQVMAVNQTATSSILESSKIEVISVMHK